MKNIKHPAFLIGVITIILFLVSGVVKYQGYRMGDWMMMAAAALAGITWIWGIFNVVTRSDMKPFQKRFWLIIVVAAPFIGAMIFHILHQKANRLTT